MAGVTWLAKEVTSLECLLQRAAALRHTRFASHFFLMMTCHRWEAACCSGRLGMLAAVPGQVSVNAVDRWIGALRERMAQPSLGARLRALSMAQIELKGFNEDVFIPYYRPDAFAWYG
ncbi:MAG: hypothetical protein JWP59_2897 [Massilia sp.]|nr:hypothetical protein [Massilia sp.]